MSKDPANEGDYKQANEHKLSVRVLYRFSAKKDVSFIIRKNGSHCMSEAIKLVFALISKLYVKMVS